jgi:membrane-bound lytic murein transglycosylase A
MRWVSAEPRYQDDLDVESLKTGLADQIRVLRQTNRTMQFGPYSIESALYAEALENLITALHEGGREAFMEAVRKDFLPLEVFGDRDWGSVFITSYYEPVIKGSKKKTAEFSSPLYGVPRDLATIRLDQFADRFDRWRQWLRGVTEQKSDVPVARARVVATDTGQWEVVPYPDRREIDVELLKTAPILAWVNPIDNFILQIQGSGAVDFASGERLRVGYAAQNGHPYVAVGKRLTHVIPLEEMTLHKIERYLKSVPQSQAMAYMGANPSYVFFQPVAERGLTFNGTLTNPGRTIATDNGFFPKGSLAFLEFERPHFDAPDTDQVASWSPVGRFVLDQDTGGAIRGPHRVDLFWGDGDEAKQHAGVMKHPGRLHYLFPRKFLVEK